MPNLGSRASWIDDAHSEPSNSSQSGHTGTNVASFPRTNILKTRAGGTFQFSATLWGDNFTSVRLQDENSGATDSGWPLLPSWPISCACRWSIQPLFTTNLVFVNVWGYLRVDQNSTMNLINGLKKCFRLKFLGNDYKNVLKLYAKSWPKFEQVSKKVPTSGTLQHFFWFLWIIHFYFFSLGHRL
jgi:hypothetical protein